MAYWGVPTQGPFTEFQLGENELFIGIPFVLMFYVMGNNFKRIGMYKYLPNGADPTQIWSVSDNTFQTITILAKTVMMYNNNGIYTIDSNKIYFSTIPNGNRLPTVGSNYTILNPPVELRYQMYRYFTDLNHSDVNLNNDTTVTLGWSSTDISGSYGNDPSIVRMYKQDGTLQFGPLPITNGTAIPISILSTIPSGIYYYTYDFTSFRLQEINSYTPPANPVFPEKPLPQPPYEVYTYGNTNAETTSTFTFITQSLQSVSATVVLPTGTTSRIRISVGIGFIGYTYLLSINDVNNFSLRTSFPYTYTPPASSTTKTYTATVSNSSDQYDTNVRTTQFIVYQYILSISISNLIIQSSQNYLSWTGGSTTDESFKYNDITLTTNGSTFFDLGDPIDMIGFTAGTGYDIYPSNVIEKIDTYETLYFDSIAPNQHVNISVNRSQQTYTVSWTSYYTETLLAPDGTRRYAVSFYPTVVYTGGPPGTVYNTESIYNKVTIPFSQVVYGIPYTIQVVDIIVATDIYFFDAPTNFAITPNKINFENTLSWVSGENPVYNVRLGNYTFQSSSPYTYNFTEDIVDPIGDVSFWPLGSPETASIITDSYNLSADTIYVALPASIPIFSGVFFSYDIGAVLYRDDTYSMSLYRNGAVVQELEENVANPFTWFPYKYVVTYQPGDQIYLKSNEHLNYGLSVPFTFVVNASVALDKTEYTVFSTIVATMTIDAETDFTAQLRGPVTIPVTFTQQGNQYTIPLNPYNIPLGNYQLDFLLVNSPTIMVTSPTFLVTTGVTLDQTEYTIISTVNATLYVGVPTTFTVTLQDADQLLPPIALPSFTANLLSTYSFKLYGLPVTDANYILQFTAGTVLTSPVFAVSTTYFSLEKPVVPNPPSRATSNTLCVTAKKNNVPTTIISIMNGIVYPKAIRGQPQFLVPCGILPYVKELTELLKTMSLRDALIFLIQKYDIPQSTPAITNQKRYQLPTANFKVLNPILQYTSSFRLSSKIQGNSVPITTFFVQKLSDARVLTLCNDDTKTFSSSYTDMLKNATYWLSTLAPFTKDGDYTFCVVRPLQGSLKQFITASISLKDNQLIFTPVILRVVLSFYEPYGPVDFSIMFTSPLLSEILKYLTAQYEKIYINPATAL
jgi:hypothetical protein